MALAEFIVLKGILFSEEGVKLLMNRLPRAQADLDYPSRLSLHFIQLSAFTVHRSESRTRLINPNAPSTHPCTRR